MKIIYSGVQQISGKKRDTGAQYAFCQLLYLRPIENVNQENRRVHAYGCELATVDLEPRSIDQFSSCVVGQEIDVEVSPNPQNMQRNIVIGLIAK